MKQRVVIQRPLLFTLELLHASLHLDLPLTGLTESAFVEVGEEEAKGHREVAPREHQPFGEVEHVATLDVQAFDVPALDVPARARALRHYGERLAT